jgi:hypothetical protein
VVATKASPRVALTRRIGARVREHGWAWAWRSRCGEPCDPWRSVSALTSTPTSARLATVHTISLMDETSIRSVVAAGEDGRCRHGARAGCCAGTCPPRGCFRSTVAPTRTAADCALDDASFGQMPSTPAGEPPCSESVQDFERLCSGAVEPVRYTGIELGRLAERHYQVVLVEHEPPNAYQPARWPPGWPKPSWRAAE